MADPIKGLDARWQQATLVVLLVLATLSGMATGVVQLIPAVQWLAVYTGLFGFLGLVAVVAWSRDTPALPFLHQKARDRGASRAALDWQVLRVSSLLLNLLIIVALITAVLEVLTAGGATEVAQATVLSALSASLNSIISLVLGFSLFQSLRTDYGIPKTTYRTVFSVLLLSGAAILAIGSIGFRTGPDASFLFLASGIFAAAGAIAWRDLPTLYTLVTEEKGPYRSGTRLTRTQSTVLPTVIAFGLLFVVLLMFMLFGATTVGRLREVVFQPSFMALAFLMIIAIIGSISAVVVLGRSKPDEEQVPLFEEFEDTTVTTQRTILFTSLGVAGIIAIFAALIGFGTGLFGIAEHRWIDMLAIALLVGLGPYGFYSSHQYNRIRRLEERFPDFLRDIASSHRGGLTLPASVAIAARGEYGPLTPEVKRMADQMSWNVPFDEALTNFAKRVGTPLIQRTVSLVQEAGRSGGSTSEVLLAAARDARQIKNMENDRRLSMTLYGVIIYITFFVFLLVATVLHNQFVPQIIASSVAIEEAGTPGNFAISVVSIEEYRAFYFLASIVQGLGGGIVAGMMATGQAILGLRHAFIMTLISYIAFALFLV